MNEVEDTDSITCQLFLLAKKKPVNRPAFLDPRSDRQKIDHDRSFDTNAPRQLPRHLTQYSQQSRKRQVILPNHILPNHGQAIVEERGIFEAGWFFLQENTPRGGLLVQVKLWTSRRSEDTRF